MFFGTTLPNTHLDFLTSAEKKESSLTCDLWDCGIASGRHYQDPKVLTIHTLTFAGPLTDSGRLPLGGRQTKWKDSILGSK